MKTKSYLGEADIVKIARWENKLNSWKWPEDFPIEKPKNFDVLPNYSEDKNIETKFNIIIPLIRDITNAIGEKETLKWHHIDSLKSNKFKFEIWWIFQKINKFFRNIGFENFYIDSYDLFGWKID